MDRRNYDSRTQSDFLEINAPYYNAINPTTVHFENENIIAFVNSLGHIEFYDQKEQSLGFVDVPAAKSPDLYGHSGQYGTVQCKADGDSICFRMPVYSWKDHYPDCDGEYDRWSRYAVRWFCVVFDCKTQQIAVLDQ